MQTEPRRRKGSRHDRTGCLTCRSRRKKCVENTFPTCGACLRLNLECIREPVRKIVKKIPLEKPQVAPTPSCLYPPAMAQSPAGSSRRRHAMQYYISELTSHLTVSNQFNAYLTAFLPMAMESGTLYSALLAFAASHLSLIDSSYEVTALEARSSALHDLATAVNTASSEITWHETNAAASLAFVIHEVGVRDCKSWYTHLRGTRDIIESTTTLSNSSNSLRGAEAFKTTSEGQWILRNFAYHDIIGSVTLRRKPLLNADYLDGISNVIDSCVGVATELLQFIGEIACLDAGTDIAKDTTKDESRESKIDLQQKCTHLERDLQHWSCHRETSPVLASMAYAYRSTALILLYRLVRNKIKTETIAPGSSPNQDISKLLQAKIQTQVEDILHHISEIPVGDAPETGLLLPLFLAGGEASDINQIDSIRTRLKLIVEKRRFQNVTQALDVLEDLWTRRWSEHEVEVDWTDILDAKGYELLLT